jgi:hypothetical protein
MKLPEEDVVLFYKLNWSLMFYANQKYQLFKELKEPDFKDKDPQKITELQNRLYSSPELIDSFVAENPFKFNQQELAIVKSWKNSVKDRFLIVSHLKDYTIFLKPEKEPKAYGVLGLYDEIQDIMSPRMPAIAETVLLPFKGKITYCGFVHSFNLQFGAGMRKTIQADYQKAKNRFGVILSLDTPISEKKESDEELLRFYVKNDDNRAEFHEEIIQILEKNPALMKIFYQELGKSNQRKISKRFSRIGIKSGWFAIYEDIVIASGQSAEDLKLQLTHILPEEIQDYVHIFRYGKK